jgi:hypothetical protein
LRILPWSQCGGQFGLAWLDQGFFFLWNLVTWWPKKGGEGLQLVQNNFLEKIAPNLQYFKGEKKLKSPWGILIKFHFSLWPNLTKTMVQAKFICGFIHFSVWWLLQFDTIVICVVTNSSVKAYYGLRSHILL